MAFEGKCLNINFLYKSCKSAQKHAYISSSQVNTIKLLPQIPLGLKATGWKGESEEVSHDPVLEKKNNTEFMTCI